MTVIAGERNSVSRTYPVNEGAKCATIALDIVHRLFGCVETLESAAGIGRAVASEREVDTRMATQDLAERAPMNLASFAFKMTASSASMTMALSVKGEN
jgi:hypothetical protein